MKNGENKGGAGTAAEVGGIDDTGGGYSVCRGPDGADSDRAEGGGGGEPKDGGGGDGGAVVRPKVPVPPSADVVGPKNDDEGGGCGREGGGDDDDDDHDHDHGDHDGGSSPRPAPTPTTHGSSSPSKEDHRPTFPTMPPPPPPVECPEDISEATATTAAMSATTNATATTTATLAAESAFAPRPAAATGTTTDTAPPPSAAMSATTNTNATATTTTSLAAESAFAPRPAAATGTATDTAPPPSSSSSPSVRPSLPPGAYSVSFGGGTSRATANPALAPPSLRRSDAISADVAPAHNGQQHGQQQQHSVATAWAVSDVVYESSTVVPTPAGDGNNGGGGGGTNRRSLLLVASLVALTVGVVLAALAGTGNLGGGGGRAAPDEDGTNAAGGTAGEMEGGALFDSCSPPLAACSPSQPDRRGDCWTSPVCDLSGPGRDFFGSAVSIVSLPHSPRANRQRVAVSAAGAQDGRGTVQVYDVVRFTDDDSNDEDGGLLNATTSNSANDGGAGTTARAGGSSPARLVPVGGPISGIDVGEEVTAELSGDGLRLAVGGRHARGGGGRVRVFELRVRGGIIATTTTTGGADSTNYEEGASSYEWSLLGEPIYGTSSIDQFGASVALSRGGDVLAVGAPTAAARGAVRVYRYDRTAADGGGWEQAGPDLVGAGVGDDFGRSVDLSADGTVVAGGARYHRGGGGGGGNYYRSGHVRVYRRRIIEGGDSEGAGVDADALPPAAGSRWAWEQLGGDISGSASGEQFGAALALSSDGLTVVGGSRPSDGRAGRARVFAYEESDGGDVSGTSSWRQVGEDVVADGPTDSVNDVSISADGSRIVAQSAGPSDDGVGYVRVYDIHRRSGGGDREWTEVGGTIAGPSYSKRYNFHSVGCSLSDDGARLALGGYYDTPDELGVVRLYEMPWRQLGSDIRGSSADDELGRVVSIGMGGGRVVVNVPHARDRSGEILSYDISEDGALTAVGQAIYGDEAGDEAQGYLSRDGRRLVVGAQFNNGVNGTIGKAGQVKVFELDEAQSKNWTLLGSPIYGEVFKERLGSKVDISHDGGIIAVSSPINGGNGNGKVGIYHYVGEEWAQLGRDIIGEEIGEQFGWDVKLSHDGTILAVGSRYGNGGGERSGSVRVFQYVSDDWRQLGQDLDGEAAGDLFGIFVSLSSDGMTLSAGAWGAGEDRGQARVFIYSSAVGEWVQKGNSMYGDGLGDTFAYVSLSADGSRLACAANFGLNSTGYTKLFDYDEQGEQWVPLGERINGQIEDRSAWLALSLEGTRLVIGGPARDADYRPGVVRLYDVVSQF